MWVGSFHVGDCTSEPNGDRPKVVGEGCHPFGHSYYKNGMAVAKHHYTYRAYIGFNWGEWPPAYESIQFFKDGNFQTNASIVFTKPRYFNAKGTNTCISAKTNGGPFGSLFTR